MSLLLHLLPVLAFANVGEFRWSTPYPDGRTQDLLAVVSPTEFFMAATRISAGIHHYRNGAWSWIPPPVEQIGENAMCIATRYSGSKVMVIIDGSSVTGTSVTFNEYSLSAGTWAQVVLREFEIGGNAACFMTNNALFIAANQTAVYDIGSSFRVRPSTNLCNITSKLGCSFIAGNNQGVYTFTGPADDLHLLRYNSTNWEDVGKVDTTISPIESLALAPDGTLYAAGNSKLATSQDGGKHWTPVAQVPSPCVSSADKCNGALYAFNDVVLMGDLDSTGIFVHNVSSGETSKREFAGRSLVAGGISNTAFVLGTYGSVWQTSLTSDVSAMTRLSKSISVDYAKKANSLCQVTQISGSVAQSKVYAITQYCNNTVGLIKAASLPLLNDWTQIGPAPLEFEDVPHGIFSLPLSNDIWVCSVSQLGRGLDGSWTIGSSDYIIVAIDGYQSSPTQSTVVILAETTFGIATGVGANVSFLPEFEVDFAGQVLSALHVSNATTFLIGSRNLTVTLDAGVTINNGSYAFEKTILAIYYRRSVDVIIVANDDGLWESVGGIANSSRTFVRVQPPAGDALTAFDSIWARNDNDIYASGERQGVIWHYTGGLWVVLATPLAAYDSWRQIPSEYYGVRGIWGTPAGDTYAGTRIGVIASPVDTLSPTRVPSVQPTRGPTRPTRSPTSPTFKPTRSPTGSPSTVSPTSSPTTLSPTRFPSRKPSVQPTRRPTRSPHTEGPTPSPSPEPTRSPSTSPTLSPTSSPSSQPTKVPTFSPTIMDCMCVNDCHYKGFDLSNNGVCEDSGPGGNGARDPQLAACLLGHDCNDCGTNNRTALKQPQSCDGKNITKGDVISGASSFLFKISLPSLGLLALLAH